MPKTQKSQLKRKIDRIVYAPEGEDLNACSKKDLADLIARNSELEVEVSRLRSRLEEMEETLDAIRTGEVDALVISGPEGENVYSLAGAEHPYRIMVESMGEGAMTLSRDGTILYANSSFARLIRKPLEQIIGSDFSRYIHSRGRAEFRSILKQGGKDSSQLEVSLSSGDRAKIPVYLSITTLLNENAPGHFSLVVTDLTHHKNEEILRKHAAELEDEIDERKKIQEQLQHARNTQQTYFDLAPAGTIVVDFSGRILQANSLTTSIFGEKVKSGSHALQKGGYSIFLPDGSPVLPSNLPFSRALAGYAVENMELVIKRSNGTERVVLAGATPLKTSYGSIWGAIAVFQDITDRKRMEEALIASRNELQSIIDGATSIIYAFDREKKFLLANKALAELLGSTPEEMIGRKRQEFMSRETAQWHEDNERKVIEQGHALEFEEHGPVKRDGRTIIWLTTKFPLRDSHGEIYAIAGVSTDITERKEASNELELKVQERTAALVRSRESLVAEIEERKRTEKRLKKAQKNLQAMAAEIVIADERSRQQFAADLHDTVIQTLGAAKLRSELLREHVSKKGTELFSDLNGLLSQSIRESRQLMAELSPPVLNQFGFVSALEWLAEQTSSQNGLKIKFRGKKGAADRLSHEVEVLLFQSTRELLMNVVKHSQAGRAAVSVIDKGESLRITVKDDGIGFHGKVSFREDKGGFGLFSIRERLRHLGGQLIIESGPGRGTRVTMVSPKSLAAAGHP